MPNDLKWIYEWFEIDATSPNDVEKALIEANGEDLEVEINSGGGDVYSGSEIYTALKGYSGNVTVKIVGVAASAAGVIAMSGKKVLISPTAQFMMHNVSSVARGDYRAFEHQAEVLKNYNVSIANAYMLKTGMKQEDLLGLMDKETWLTAQRAVEYGFADEVMFDDNNQLTASINNYILPPEVISKIRNLVKQNTQEQIINTASGGLIKKQEPAQPNEPVDQKEDEKTVEIKTTDELRNAYPELVAQVEAAARAEGATGERERMKGIDEISATIAPELVNKAKYEQPMSAQELAFDALKADAAKGQQYNSTRTNEIKNSGSGQVSTDDGSTMSDKDKDAAVVDKIAASANQKRNRGDKK